jgi:hypothetical protein
MCFGFSLPAAINILNFLHLLFRYISASMTKSLTSFMSTWNCPNVERQSHTRAMICHSILLIRRMREVSSITYLKPGENDFILQTVEIPPPSLAICMRTVLRKTTRHNVGRELVTENNTIIVTCYCAAQASGGFFHCF